MSGSSEDLPADWWTPFDEASSRDSAVSRASSKLGDLISPPNGCPPCLPPVYEPSSTPLNPNLPRLTLRKHLYHGSKTVKKMFTIDYNALRKWEQKEQRLKRMKMKMKNVKEEKQAVIPDRGKAASCSLTVNIPHDNELARLSEMLGKTFSGYSNSLSSVAVTPIWNNESSPKLNPPFRPIIQTIGTPYEKPCTPPCQFTPIIDYCHSQLGFPVPRNDLNLQPLSTAPPYQPMEQFTPEIIKQSVITPEPVITFGHSTVPPLEESPAAKFPPLSTIFGLATSNLYSFPTVTEDPPPLFDITHIIKDARGIVAPGAYPILAQTTVTAPSVAIPPGTPNSFEALFAMPPIKKKVYVKRNYVVKKKQTREKKKATKVEKAKSEQKFTKVYMKKEQREHLERFFEANSQPSLLDYEALATQMSTSIQRLRVWFYNRRAKVKREGRGDEEAPEALKKRTKKGGKKKVKGEKPKLKEI